MKNFYTFFLLLALVSLSKFSFSQYCSYPATPPSMANLTLSTSSQLVQVNSGDLYFFNVNVGDTFYFTFCNANGSSSEDTYMTLYNNSNAPIHYNDDGCAPYGPSEFSYIAQYTGTYQLYITHYGDVGDPTNFCYADGSTNLGNMAFVYTHIIGGIAPTANFSANQTNVPVNTTVTFTDLSTDTPTSWDWDFGDVNSGIDNTSTLQNPIHVFNSQGTYDVTLVATNSSGSNTITKTNYIIVNPNSTTLTITSNLGEGWFIEGVTPVMNTFTSVNSNSGITATFYLKDSNGSIISTEAGINSSNSWSAQFDMGIAKNGSTVSVAFSDASTATYNLNVIAKPSWLVNGGSASVVSTSGGHISMNCNLPVSILDEIIPSRITALGGKHFGIDACGLRFDADFTMSDPASTVTSNSELFLDLNFLGMSKPNSKSIPNTTINLNQNFNISSTYSDSITIFEYKKDFKGLKFPLGPIFSIKISGGLQFDGKILGKVVFGDNGNNNWGFIDNGIDRTRLYARATGVGTISAGLEVLGGVASATGNLFVRGRLGVGFDFVNVPSVVMNPIFGGHLTVEGNVVLKALSFNFFNFFRTNGIEMGRWPVQGTKCFYGCLGDEGKFGNMPGSKLLSQTNQGLFNGSSATFMLNAANEIPQSMPQPTIGVRDNNLCTVWIESDVNQDYLLFAKLDSNCSAFSDPIIIESNDNSISNPKVGLMPSGAAIITWTQNRYNSNDLTASTSLEELINAQDIWMAVYNFQNNTLLFKQRVDDDTTNLQSGRSEGQANISMGTAAKGLLTWVSKNPLNGSSQIMYSEITENPSWDMTPHSVIPNLPYGNNFSVQVSYVDATKAIAVWISDPDSNDSTLNSTIYYSYWNGSSWSVTPSVLIGNTGLTSYDELSIDYNHSFCSLAWTSTVYDSNDNFEKKLNIEVWNDNTHLWDPNQSLDATSTDFYFNKPRVSISDQGILSIVYQVFKLYNDSSNFDAGKLYMYLKDLNNSASQLEDVTGNEYLSDSTKFVYDVDAGFGGINNLFVITQEIDPISGNVTSPINGVLFGDHDLSMVLRGLKVNSDLSITDEQEPDNIPTGIKKDKSISGIFNFELRQNYPNPYDNVTSIGFTIKQSSYVTLDVTDMTGRQLARLVDQTMSAGMYQSVFNSGDLESGIYFFTLTVNNKSITKRMVITK